MYALRNSIQSVLGPAELFGDPIDWLIDWLIELFVNVVCSADEDIDSKYPTNIVVLSDGTCSWIPLGLFISTCAIDIRWFPFDDQFCRMKFGSWSYDQSKINLTAKDHTVDLTTYQPSGEWDLVGRTLVKLFHPSFGQSASRSINRPIGWSISRVIDQPVDRSVDQSVIWSISHLTNQLVDRSVSWSINYNYSSFI